MAYLRAEVRNGRLLLDVPSTLPDGAIVELVVVSVGSGSPDPEPHGEFDDAEADTAVGPLLAEESAWTSLSKPNG